MDFDMKLWLTPESSRHALFSEQFTSKRPFNLIHFQRNLGNGSCIPPNSEKIVENVVWENYYGTNKTWSI